MPDVCEGRMPEQPPQSKPGIAIADMNESSASCAEEKMGGDGDSRYSDDDDEELSSDAIGRLTVDLAGIDISTVEAHGEAAADVLLDTFSQATHSKSALQLADLFCTDTAMSTGSCATDEGVIPDLGQADSIAWFLNTLDTRHANAISKMRGVGRGSKLDSSHMVSFRTVSGSVHWADDIDKSLLVFTAVGVCHTCTHLKRRNCAVELCKIQFEVQPCQGTHTAGQTQHVVTSCNIVAL
jgi:hypothetical protein